MKKLSKNSIGLCPMLSLFLLSFCLVFSSCTFGEADGKGDDDFPAAVVVYDVDGETDYYATVFDSERNSITMVKTGDDGLVTAFDHLFVEDNAFLSATFNEDGLLSGIGVDGATMAFSNYNGNKVDVAVMLGDETLLLKEYECPNDWDAQKGELYFTLPQENTRAAENKKTLNDALVFLGKQFMNLGDVVSEGIKGGNPKLIAFRYLYSIVDDAADLLTDDTDSEMEYAELLTEIGVLAISQPTTPWGALILLLSEYDTYVNFVEDVTYDMLEMYDNFVNDRDNGLGALESGYGALKATLSWNFYADIDLHAMEPSGCHIYYSNKISYDSGGFLDVDNTYGGPGSVENIYWEEAPEGDYRIYIDYFGPGHSPQGGQTGVCTVSVYYRGLGKTYNIPMVDDQTTTVTTVSLPSGAQNSAATRSADIQIILTNKANSNK